MQNSQADASHLCAHGGACHTSRARGLRGSPRGDEARPGVRAPRVGLALSLAHDAARVGRVCGGAWGLVSGPLAVSSLSGGPGGRRRAGAPSQTCSPRGPRSPAGHQPPHNLAASRPPCLLCLRVRGPGTWTGPGGGGLCPLRGVRGHSVHGVFLVTCGLSRLDRLRALEAGQAHQHPRPARLVPTLGRGVIVCSDFHVTSERGGLGHETLPRGFCGLGSDSSGRPGAGAWRGGSRDVSRGCRHPRVGWGWRTRSALRPPTWLAVSVWAQPLKLHAVTATLFCLSKTSHYVQPTLKGRGRGPTLWQECPRTSGRK